MVFHTPLNKKLAVIVAQTKTQKGFVIETQPGFVLELTEENSRAQPHPDIYGKGQRSRKNQTPEKGKFGELSLGELISLQLHLIGF